MSAAYKVLVLGPISAVAIRAVGMTNCGPGSRLAAFRAEGAQADVFQLLPFRRSQKMGNAHPPHSGRSRDN